MLIIQLKEPYYSTDTVVHIKLTEEGKLCWISVN